MNLSAFLKELETESASTRRMLERVPAEHFEWKPHEKSYSLGRLASHVAELPSMITRVLTTDELDFMKEGFKSSRATSSQELIQIFENSLAGAKKAVEEASEDGLGQRWKMRAGEVVYIDLPKHVALRSLGLNHIIHHRGQLSVYLRLLNVPVPGMYGPTADEPM